jgi:hypothetical protein
MIQESRDHRYSPAQFTAPMSRADSASSSSNSITATLCGSEQLKPIQPIAVAPRTASARFSAATSQLMYRASMP